MKKYLAIAAICFLGSTVRAQVLPAPLVYQQEDQWCWAGVTKCVLNYYGKTVSQCDIAEYTRTVATWHSYGSVHCCLSATSGCNYPNYNWGQTGSIQDILVHFGSVANTGVSGVLTTSQIASDVAANRLFIPRWAWTTGGGHFVVGHGISGTGSGATIYYMNPWVGEGFHFATYSWMQSGTGGTGTHTWSGTNRITSFPAVNGVEEVEAADNGVVYPNPSTGEVWVKGNASNRLSVYNATGALVYEEVLKSNDARIGLGDMPRGIYIMKLSGVAGSTFAKLVLQ